MHKRASLTTRIFLIALGALGIIALMVMVSAAFLIIRLPDIDETNNNSLDSAASAAVEKTDSAFSDRFVVVSSPKNETLRVLDEEKIPANDPIKLAIRVGGLASAPYFKSEFPGEMNLGDMKEFWVLDVDSNDYRQTKAVLTYITPHLYFWVEDGLFVDQSSVAALAETFENQIYPATREIFGSEWSPGVDHDEHLTILYARGLGGAAGYFSSTDSLTREVEPYSNEAEMFYLSADYTFLSSPYTYGVLAHELQHMIHWNIDRNESAWINEGLSELSVELNGFDSGGFGFLFSIDPDLQLNFWPGNDQGDSTPHYGASYLFMKYLMERFGLDSIKELVSSGEVGLAGIDFVFSQKEDELGQLFTSEQIFQDWSLENFAAGSEYSLPDSKYADMDDFPPFLPTERIACDAEWYEREVKQFGSDYIAIECFESFTIELVGEENVPLLPVDPFSGDYYFWSNYGDSSNMMLSRTFNFKDISGEIILEYWTWFDIESDYDYLYLLASIDGQDWEILNTGRCTREDPTGSNYGCGYNGKSHGWVNESVNLSKFAGNTVMLQFEYITDLAVNGDGFLIDDISIQAIDYFTDFEMDDGGWIGEGFVRLQNRLPQNYGIGWLGADLNSNDQKRIYLGGLSVIDTVGKQDRNIAPVVVINGLTRYTRQPASYRIKITSLD